MSGLTDHFKDVLFLSGHNLAKGLVAFRFDSQDGSRIELKIPPLEAVLLSRQLEEALVSADIEFPKNQRD